MLALVASVSQETKDMKRAMVVERETHRDGCRVFLGRYAGKSVLLAQTGIGRKRVERAVCEIMDRFPVNMLVSLGFAGGLSAYLRTGDVVVCSRVVCDHRGEALADSVTQVHAAPVALVSLALSLADRTVARVYAGTGVTSSAVVWNPEEKRRLAAGYGADVVDMESYWVAAMAYRTGLPFLNVRAVSDSAGSSIVPFGKALDDEGRWRWGPALGLFVRPWEAAKLPTFYADVRRAGRSLAAYADRLVSRL